MCGIEGAGLSCVGKLCMATLIVAMELDYDIEM